MVIKTETEVKQVVEKRRNKKILVSFAGVSARWSHTVESMVFSRSGLHTTAAAVN